MSEPCDEYAEVVRNEVETFIPLDRSRWPAVGDEVLYRRGDGSGWTSATVLAVAAHDGDLELDTGEGPALSALDVKHGNGLHQWLHYGETPRRDT